MELKNLGQTAASALIHTDIRLEREHWTMFRNKLLGIAAAATLGTAAMLGSTAANAVKICHDTAPADLTELMACPDSVTYATETLLMGAGNVTGAIDNSDTTVYHNITDTVVLSAPADVGGSSDSDYTIEITLDGMVFQNVPSLAGGGVSTAGFTLVRGGAVGEDNVKFELNTGTLTPTTDLVNLTANYAVSAEGGSATLTMVNMSASETETLTGDVIMVAPALDEVSTKMNPVADVEEGFMKFVGDQTVATVGSLMVGADDTHLVADGGAASAVDTIMDTTTAADGTPNSTVTFSGDFSFASKVYLHGDNDCGVATTDGGTESGGTDTTLGSAASDIRVEVDDVVMGSTEALNVRAFATAQFLCIMVDPAADDAMPIPATEAYTAMGSYAAIENAAIGPMPEEQTLGMIRRNGVTYRIPYITTYDGYNQRLVMVNRGGSARYEIEFTPEDGITADPESLEGTLAAGTTMMLTRNIVELSGGARTAASITVEATPGSVDIATVTVNNSDGSTDTVTYMPN